MHVVFEHRGILPVLKYGGTERIIYWLMKALKNLGHQVTLIGNAKSNVAKDGINLIVHPGGNWEKVIPKNADVVHLFHNYKRSELKHVPVLVTIEGNGRPGETFSKNTVFISKKHAENHSAEKYVYNGIDFDEYPFDESKNKQNNSQKKFLFLAKARWKVKNLEHCVWACKKAKRRLAIAGGYYWGWPSYIKSYGMVDTTKKLQLMKDADALLFPVRWHEPFGIAIIEAMAQGLWVVGSPYGSLPELIAPVSGVIVRNKEELLAHISKSHFDFEPRKIHDYAKKHFSKEVMADEYLKLYALISAGKELHTTFPIWKLEEHAESLLPF